MRVDSVLLAAGFALAGGVAPAYPAPAILCAVFTWLAFRGQLRRRAQAALFVVFALGALRGAREIRRFEAERVLERDALGAPSRCDLIAVVETSPTWSDGSASFIAQVTRADCEGRALPVPFSARLRGGPDSLARQDRVHAIADLAPIQLFRNQGTADPTPAAARRGVVLSGSVLSLDLLARRLRLTTLIDRARGHARKRIAQTFAPAASAMARALVLGENDLPPDEALAFQKSGLSHMLAVSGTHLVFAVVALVHALTFMLVRVERLSARFVVSRISAALGVPLALIYADFAGGSGSAWRAAFMLSTGFLAHALGRRPETVRTFGLSTLAFAALDPLCAFDLSFMLSIAATAGLIWIGQPLNQRCERITSRPVRFLVSSFATTLSATIPCAPLLALLAAGVTCAGLVANVLAAPLGEGVALPLCLAHLLFGPFAPLERGAALVASGALLVVKQIALASARASFFGVTLPEPQAFQLALLVVFVVGLSALSAQLAPELSVRSRRRARRAWYGASLFGVLALEVALRRAGSPHGVLRASALDVGQGDSNLIDFPNGTLMLIDGGGFVGSPVDPGRAVVLPVLRSRRRTRVDIVVLSHPHPDHFTGLASALPELDVGEFWDTGQGEAEGAGPVYARLLAALRARHVPIRHPDELCNAPRDLGGATLRVLAPCPSFTPHRGANDNSWVISLSFGRRAFLLMGDAEQEEEAELLAAHSGALRADYLKVGHHGSRTSTSEAFLAVVAPTLATLSCGVRNRFGHPHLSTLARLAAHGVHAERLDRSGSVIVSTNGDALSAFRAHVPL